MEIDQTANHGLEFWQHIYISWAVTKLYHSQGILARTPESSATISESNR